jgi:hypothetical protein
VRGQNAVLIADVCSSWTVVVLTPAGETVAAGNWPELPEAREWARGINRSGLAQVRFVAPLVVARDLEIELAKGVWR